MKFSEAYELFVVEHPTWAKSTVETARQRVAKFSRWLNMGERPVDEISCADINEWTEYSEKKLGMDGNVRLLIRQQLLNFFRWLEAKKIIAVNPLDIRLLTKLVPQQINRPPFTYEHHLKILEHAKTIKVNPYWHGAAILGWHTGLRSSDIACLLWADIDFANKILNRTPIKTSRFRKTISIPMEPEVLEYLNQLWDRKQSGEFLCSPHVFPLMYYSYEQQRTTLPYQFRYILQKCGIPDRFSFHSYRHAFISRLLNAGVNVKIIQSMTGQSLPVLYSYVTVDCVAQRGALELARVKPTLPALESSSSTTPASSAVSPST